MSSDTEDQKYKAYKEDPRIPCQYGVKCYQKNELHHKKYKHPPKTAEKVTKNRKRKVPAKKRTVRDRDGVDKEETPENSQSKEKILKVNPQPDRDEHNVSPSISSDESEENNDVPHTKANSPGSVQTSDDDNKIHLNKKEEEAEHIEEQLKKSNITEDKHDNHSVAEIPDDVQSTINEIFLVKMPADFYKFYDFCKTVSKDDPSSALKVVHLKLVGPYDVLSEKIKKLQDGDEEKYLRHWRYYYDPPEFQTVIKGSDKDEVHFGYWRDDPAENPVFVAKNAAKANSIIESVAENIFGAVNAYMEEKEKTANPFEKSSIIRLHRLLKNFAKENDITLEKSTAAMRGRERKVVARTFHKAGIVVPYQQKTQLGYRDLSVSNKELKKILKDIDEAASSSERVAPFSKLEEVMRLATIAADECDFGTCLELGHDLFSSGVVHVEQKALQMLSIAYTHLQRPAFLKIAEAHLKDRKKGCDLSVI